MHVRRVYVAQRQAAGTRVLVVRCWPRGMSKGRAHLDVGGKQVAPPTELRKGNSHDPEAFTEFGHPNRAEPEDPGQADALAHPP
ncbi:DUF488 domain-containing protein, partial [Streptomyces sp. GbtcB7]|uniref:DUF488 domain-containing protein n=1 Tax=Streptomyces sp. GbtcB7 TaxID=2824752 RepID=UPI001C2F8BD5